MKANVNPKPGGPYWTPITPKAGSLFHADSQLRQLDILTAVNRLPDDQRSVLLLISVEDLSYADAARVLDVPIGTVMSRLARARARLLRIMEEDAAPASGRPYLRRVQ